jgi:hypothetical protein
MLVMKCFRHSDLDAVGLCKYCQKGLCTICFADVGNGLACKNICEKRVRELSLWEPKNRKLVAASGSTVIALFCAGGVLDLGVSTVFGSTLLLVGAAAGLLAGTEFLSVWKVGRPRDTSTSVHLLPHDSHKPDHLEDAFRQLEQDQTKPG